MRRFFFWLILIAIVLLVLETIGYFALKASDGYQETRQLLLAKQSPTDVQNVVGQPYLLYTSAPGLHKHGFQQHNDDGYRGEAVELVNPSDAYRILFLGGSTTYSFSVNNPDSSFPAVVGQLLSESSSLPNGVNKVEVMNCGLPWGTSSEMLIHYQLKYRYYNPDLVVLHTGGNDAYTHNLGGEYQPDYSHFRKTLPQFKIGSGIVHWLLRSRLMAFFYIRLKYGDVNESSLAHGGEYTTAKWFSSKPEIDGRVDLDYNAFYNNMNSLIASIKQDSTDILLMPFVYNPYHPQNSGDTLQLYKEYQEILYQIAEGQALPLADWQAKDIDESEWTDDCHLNESGVKKKAAFLVPYIQSLWVADSLPE